MEIILIRHGQDTDNKNKVLNGHRDTELTDLGKKQAKKVAKKLKDDDVDIIISSPLKRTMKTAEIIAKEIGVDKILEDDLLIERDFGILTGKLISEIDNYAEKTFKFDGVNYFLRAKNLEEFPDCYKRGKKFIDRLRDKYEDETIVVVTHGDIGKMIRAVYHDWSWKQGLKTPYFDNAEALHLKEKEDFIE